MTHDVIILGSGVAGLSAALHLAPTHRVAVISKSRLGAGGSSPYAQGGVAVALGADDSPRSHSQDTVAVGVGLNDPLAVDVLTSEGPARVLELLEMGARFDRAADGSLALGREAAHSQRRIVHAADATGAELVRTLVEAVRRTGVLVYEECFAHDLVVRGDRVCGVRVQHPDGRVVEHRAGAVVLATGGCGQLWSHTTNPVECTGDGLAMAFRAGARLRDLEFMQFHPTALPDGALLTEALRGEGARLIDENGQRFIDELAPRDVVARAIWRHGLEGHQTLLDATHLDFAQRFPTVLGLCQARGLDPRQQPMPVTPAAHYHMGGVEVDLAGRTSLTGLWACGEVTASGVHGANRLASNSLLEGLVYGVRVGRDIAASALRRPLAGTVVDRSGRWRDGDPLLVGVLRDVMWREVGLVRHASGLERALSQLERLGARLQEPQGEAANMLCVARLIAVAARERRESRGAHYRSDCPDTRSEWCHHLVTQLGQPLGKVS